MKGHTQTESNGGGGRVVVGGSRSYGLVLMFAFAFGAAFFGVMTLHKLRERRIFNLVLKDKDLQLNSLHLHLQVLIYPSQIYQFFRTLVHIHILLCMHPSITQQLLFFCLYLLQCVGVGGYCQYLLIIYCEQITSDSPFSSVFTIEF